MTIYPIYRHIGNITDGNGKLRLMDHECELDLNVEKIYSFPCKTRWEQFLRISRRFFMASMYNPRALGYLKNRSAIVYEKKRHLLHDTEVIHPFSVFRRWWDFFIFIMSITSLLYVPYQAAFDITRTLRYWTITKNILLLICFIDIILNFMTGYFNKSRGTVEMNRKKISRNYILHDTFIPDVIGSLPTDLFFLRAWNDWIVAREVASLVHIFRLPSTHSYIIRIAEMYELPRGYFGMISFIPLLMIILHWLACISWIVPIASASLSTIKQPSELSWINTNNLWKQKDDICYWHCLVRTITILTRSGVSETVFDEDQYTAVAMQAVCVLVSCYIVSQAMRLFKADNSSKLKYQAIIAQLKQYMRHKQLPRVVQQRFLTYYEFKYQHKFFRESEILNTLSAQMRQEIRMHLCRKLVEHVEIFHNLPVSLLTRIVGQLKSEVFLTNDVIVRAKEPGDCMYFIATGTVAIYTDSGKEICHLEDGAYFGEIALVMPEVRVATAIAVETCELYRLERSDFMRTIYPYPMLWERIKNIAIERHEKTKIIDAR
ncbi:potassium/sodium hyperpolarization-activated cyclic nucleotide-gated channel 1-like [Chelonus insularis]|uniref:potassium/sodium hyperpolarization-activated cyclic nucleotide-gated channel 1-like n=1 Tax=Chelonus insularis TaxID=460826 RepID=UPI00158CDA61|nr:potassium/sodium hyperpolarization-activated cyclic nucleotide-gated channel 1-like [Chelonus insularis]